MAVDIGGMRKPYMDKDSAFTEDMLVSKEPLQQFKQWFELAAKTAGIEEANAMSLATSTKEGKPSVRMVLLKAYGEDGFKFFTNYDSRKGRELTQNPFAALNFYWEPLKRCVRIEGHVKKLSEKESTEYFESRPLGSQIGAAVSPQSQPITNRDVLLQREKELIALGNTTKIRKPEKWGGYVVVPDTVEFWQGQTNRIHDRIRFRKLKPGEKVDDKIAHRGANGWAYERLAP